jgi:drug/metabolite transporter (DMT)-like permease
VLVLRKVEEFTLSDKTLIGDMLTVLNCLSFAFFLAYSKKFLEQHDRVWTTTWLFIYGSVGLTMLALPDWTSFHWPEMTNTLLACMIFAIVGGTLMTYFLNNWTLTYTQSSSVAIFIYLQPVIASALAWFWFGDRVTLRTVLSGLLIFCGVLLALYSGPRPQITPVRRVNA